MTHAGPEAVGSPDVTTPLPVVTESTPVEVRPVRPTAADDDGLEHAEPPVVPVRVSVRSGAVPTSAPAPATTTLICPGCSQPRTVTLSRRDAQDFCPDPDCDYPLFWARRQDAVGGPDGDVDAARRRSPGTSGAERLVSVPCPACGELNPPAEASCLRCRADMTPPPPPVPVPVPLPQPVVEVAPPREPEPAEPFPVLWLVAMLAISGAAWAVSALL